MLTQQQKTCTKTTSSVLNNAVVMNNAVDMKLRATFKLYKRITYTPLSGNLQQLSADKYL